MSVNLIPSALIIILLSFFKALAVASFSGVDSFNISLSAAGLKKTEVSSRYSSILKRPWSVLAKEVFKASKEAGLSISSFVSMYSGGAFRRVSAVGFENFVTILMLIFSAGPAGASTTGASSPVIFLAFSTLKLF